MDSQIIITSAATAALIAGGFNWFFREFDYRYDYKKYILKRRQEAYQEVERNLIILNRTVFSPLHPGQQVHEIFCADKHTNPLEHYLTNEMSKVLEGRIWLSHGMLLRLVNLNKLLLNISYEDPTPSPTPESLYQRGFRYHQQISLHIMELQLQLFNDLKSLDKIRSFKKNSFFN
ncbi:MAG: hypothetical protein HYZ15_04060 [Sphingobacteriales bacterium]|nr:hypothetical protein [Sphingobacteriales bacterium]